MADSPAPTDATRDVKLVGLRRAKGGGRVIADDVGQRLGEQRAVVRHDDEVCAKSLERQVVDRPCGDVQREDADENAR